MVPRPCFEFANGFVEQAVAVPALAKWPNYSRGTQLGKHIRRAAEVGDGIFLVAADGQSEWARRMPHASVCFPA
jgi:hypothetical protein